MDLESLNPDRADSSAAGKAQLSQPAFRDGPVGLRRNVALGKVVEEQVIDESAAGKVELLQIFQRSEFRQPDHSFGRDVGVAEVNVPHVGQLLEHAANVAVADAAAG